MRDTRSLNYQYSEKGQNQRLDAEVWWKTTALRLVLRCAYHYFIAAGGIRPSV